MNPTELEDGTSSQRSRSATAKSTALSGVHRSKSTLLRLMHDFSVDDGHQHRNLWQRVGVTFHDVFREGGEIAAVTYFDHAGDVLFGDRGRGERCVALQHLDTGKRLFRLDRLAI